MINSCECGMKMSVGQSRLPRRAQARARISARLGFSLRSFEAFPGRPSARHGPAMALPDVHCTGRALASQSDRTPFFGRGWSIGAQAGREEGRERSGQPAAEAETSDCSAASHSLSCLSIRRSPLLSPAPAPWSPERQQGAKGTAGGHIPFGSGIARGSPSGSGRGWWRSCQDG